MKRYVTYVGIAFVLSFAVCGGWMWYGAETEVVSEKEYSTMYYVADNDPVYFLSGKYIDEWGATDFVPFDYGPGVDMSVMDIHIGISPPILGENEVRVLLEAANDTTIENIPRKDSFSVEYAPFEGEIYTFYGVKSYSGNNTLVVFITPDNRIDFIAPVPGWGSGDSKFTITPVAERRLLNLLTVLKKRVSDVPQPKYIDFLAGEPADSVYIPLSVFLKSAGFEPNKFQGTNVVITSGELADSDYIPLLEFLKSESLEPNTFRGTNLVITKMHSRAVTITFVVSGFDENMEPCTHEETFAYGLEFLVKLLEELKAGQ